MGGPDQQPIARLRRLATALGGGAAPSAHDAAWFSSAVAAYEAGPADSTFDKAIGLAPAPGCESWRTTEARAKRDAAIAELRREHFADLNDAEAARAIYQLARRMQNTAWQAAQTDPRKQLIVKALRSGLPFPAERRLEMIFTKSVRAVHFVTDDRIIVAS